MKIIKLVAFILSIFFLQSFSYQSFNKIYLQENPCDSVPALNKQIVAFAKSNLGKKVKTGQCWDLAAEALNSAGAKWNGQYIYGNEVDPKTDCIFPGDIIQFEGVQIEYKKDGSRFIESMGHHTAIIYKVNAPGNYELAHQNFGNGAKKVGITNLELKNITKGKIFVYQPTK